MVGAVDKFFKIYVNALSLIKQHEFPSTFAKIDQPTPFRLMGGSTVSSIAKTTEMSLKLLERIKAEMFEGAQPESLTITDATGSEPCELKASTLEVKGGSPKKVRKKPAETVFKMFNHRF